MKRARVALALCALVAGCAGGSDDPWREPLPPEPTVIKVTMREYRFDRDASQRIRAGRVVFQVRNAGRVSHQIILLAIPKDLPVSFNEQLHSKTRRATLPLGILEARRPGQTGAFAIDLPAGRYGMVCFLSAPDGQSHALKGMNSEFRVE